MDNKSVSIKIKQKDNYYFLNVIVYKAFNCYYVLTCSEYKMS